MIFREESISNVNMIIFVYGIVATLIILMFAFKRSQFFSQIDKCV